MTSVPEKQSPAANPLTVTGTALPVMSVAATAARSNFTARSGIPSLSKSPVVVVHATDDRFVPIAAGRALYQAATAPKLMVESRGGHNSAGFSPISELAEALARFWPTTEMAGALAD